LNCYYLVFIRFAPRSRAIMSANSKCRSTPRKSSIDSVIGAVRKRVLHPIFRLFSSSPTTLSIGDANHDMPDSEDPPQAQCAVTRGIITYPGVELPPVEFPISIPESDTVNRRQDETALSHWYSQVTPGVHTITFCKFVMPSYFMFRIAM
jgi:hypothetical protein